MSLLNAQISEAENLSTLWRQRRNRVACMWKDGQWKEFEERCNQAVQQLLKKHVRNTTELDKSLAEALRKLN